MRKSSAYRLENSNYTCRLNVWFIFGAQVRKRLISFYTAIALSLPCSAALAEKIKLDVSVYSEHFATAKHQFLGATACHETPLDEPPHLAQMENALLCKALHLGGIEVEYRIQAVPNQARAVRLLESGKHTVFAASLWHYLKNDSVYVSTPVVPKGNFQKGLYVSPSNEQALAAKKLSDIVQLTAAVGPTWEVDKKILNCLNIKQFFISDYPKMLQVVSSNRADFILHNFTDAEDLSLKDFNAHLTPIPGIKVEMPDSLHFFISKAHPQAKKIYKALNKGLKKLRSTGELDKGYESVGFYNPKVKNWKSISCPPDA